MSLIVVMNGAEALSSIEAFLRDLPASEPLQRKLGTFKSWYAVERADGSLLLGPSKFIGYRDIDSEKYARLSGRRGNLHGAHTENALRALGIFEPVEVESPVHRRLLAELAALYAAFGKRPNIATRFSIRRASADAGPAEAGVAMTPAEIDRWIVRDKDICFGRPTLRGTRIRVSDLLGLLAAGETAEDLASNYPTIRREHVAAALAYAAQALDHAVVRAA
jgi:uncharacterized protein (DUF433 family)